MKNRELSKDYIKTKNFINIMSSLSVVILGIFFFLIPTISDMEPNKILFVIMLLYFGIKISEYILTRKSKDNETIWVAIANALAAAAAIQYGSVESNVLVSVSLSVWILMLTIIKLIKINEYRDEENTLMYFNIVTMSLFVLIGILSVISIYRTIISINLILGFFFIIEGILHSLETGFRIGKENREKGKKKKAV